MTTLTAVLLVLAGVAAVGDWVAVVRDDRRIRLVTKPATLVFLIAAAIALHPFDPTVRTWLVIGLVCSLAGDVFLLHDAVHWFIAGLVSFLLGHIAYVVGLQFDRDHARLMVVGAVVVVAMVSTVGRRIVAGVRSGPSPELTAPVIAYLTVISAMVISAFGTGSPWAIGGALLFYASDAILAWNRFLDRRPWMDLAVMTTYHLAQGGLVLFLLR